MRYAYKANPDRPPNYYPYLWWSIDEGALKAKHVSAEQLQDLIKAVQLLGHTVEEVRTTANPRPTIVISYPPDYDGELHIAVQPNVKGLGKNAMEVESYTYSFTHSNKVAADGNKRDAQNDWRTLVCAAKAIVTQDDRIRESEKRQQEFLATGSIEVKGPK